MVVLHLVYLVHEHTMLLIPRVTMCRHDCSMPEGQIAATWMAFLTRCIHLSDPALCLCELLLVAECSNIGYLRQVSCKVLFLKHPLVSLQVYACLHSNDWLAKVAGPTGALQALVALLSPETSADALRLRTCAALALTALCSASPDAGRVSHLRHAADSLIQSVMAA